MADGKADEHAYTPDSAASGVESLLRLIDGRWKLVILFHLFGGQVQRFSQLEKAIPDVSQKMLAQQLRQLEADGVVIRTVHPQVRRWWTIASPPGASRCVRRWTRC